MMPRPSLSARARADGPGPRGRAAAVQGPSRAHGRPADGRSRRRSRRERARRCTPCGRGRVLVRHRGRPSVPAGRREERGPSGLLRLRATRYAARLREHRGRAGPHPRDVHPLRDGAVLRPLRRSAGHGWAGGVARDRRERGDGGHGAAVAPDGDASSLIAASRSRWYGRSDLRMRCPTRRTCARCRGSRGTPRPRKAERRHERSSHYPDRSATGGRGLEPRLPGPKPGVLPIGRPPNGSIREPTLPRPVRSPSCKASSTSPPPRSHPCSRTT